MAVPSPLSSKAYGLAKWRRMLLVFVLYFATYIASVFMLHDVRSSDESTCASPWGLPRTSHRIGRILAIVHAHVAVLASCCSGARKA
eukprot:7149359-Prymnesium_polylepis.1